MLRLTLSRVERDLVAARRGDASRLGYAVQLDLLRHPGKTLAGRLMRIPTKAATNSNLIAATIPI